MLNFFFIGMLFVAILYFVYSYSLHREMSKCDKVKYVYKPYIRTFVEEQTNPVSPLGLYKDMFYKPGPWWDATGNASKLPEKTIQPFSWQGLPKSEVLREGESSNFVNSYFG